jgi:sugar phosphate isomerase/epimerase
MMAVNVQPELAISQFTTYHNSFEEDVESYVATGVRFIDVVERKMSDQPSVARRQAQLVTDAGLTVIGFTPRVHALFPDTLSPTPTDPRHRCEQFKRSLDFVAECWPGQSIPVVAITGRAPDYDYCTAYQVAHDVYGKLADYASGAGLRIMLEPLSPILMNMDTFICTLARTLQFVRQIGHPNFGILCDVWHLWDETGILEAIEGAGPLIFSVQISDWPRGEPRNFADRLLPGDGLIDFPALLGALERAGFQGAYSLEIFSDDKLPGSLWLRPAAELVGRCREALSTLWAQRH